VTEGPISKARLAITDVTILLLQLVMLAATIAKLGLLEGVTEGRRRGGDVGEGDRTHDLDSEERGERRGEWDSESEEESDLEDGNDVDGDGGIDDLERGGEQGEELDGTLQRRRHHRRRRRRPRWSTGGEDGNGFLSHSRQRRSTSTTRSRRTSIGGEHEPGGGGDDDDGGRYAQYSGELVVAGLSIVNAVRWQWSHGSPGSVAGGGEGGSSTTGAAAAGRSRAATGASGGGEGTAIRGLDALNQLSRLRA